VFGPEFDMGSAHVHISVECYVDWLRLFELLPEDLVHIYALFIHNSS